VSLVPERTVKTEMVIAPTTLVRTARVLKASGVPCPSCHTTFTIEASLPPEPTAEVRDDIKTVLRGFEDGLYTRSVALDHEPGWQMKFLPYLAALARLKQYVEGEKKGA
jgi:hypothetical protein